MRHRCYLEVSDVELVQEAQAGDRKAFDTLVSRYRGAVTLVAREVLPRAAADDVAQDVFVVAYYSLSRLREPGKFASWLYAIARYRARRVAAQEQRVIPTEPIALQSLSETALSNDTAGSEARHSELAEAFSRLKPENRLVLFLRYEEQWTIARIAAFLSLPETTVNWRLHSGRADLKQALLSSKENENDGRERNNPR